jgi:hypothetical protein
MQFFCSICSEESTRICARCTKDTCANHLCDKCGKCSDCCECEVTLSEHAPMAQTARSVFPRPEPAPEPLPDPDPEPAPPDPDPVVEEQLVTEGHGAAEETETLP